MFLVLSVYVMHYLRDHVFFVLLISIGTLGVKYAIMLTFMVKVGVKHLNVYHTPLFEPSTPSRDKIPLIWHSLDKFE